MNRTEVELRVHRLIDDVLAGRPVEDDLVELKSDWPSDFRRAARRIAGHANASGQQPILWVIGIDEKGRTISGASSVDPAQWYPQVKSHFAGGWAPPVSIVAVPRDGKILVALVFETDATPFLVSADPDLFEVPWRDATRIRSAKRHELLRMFGDVVHLPDLDVIDASLAAQANRVVPPDEIIGHTFSAMMQLYITPKTDRAIHLPLFRTKITLHPDHSTEVIDLGEAHAQVVDDSGARSSVRKQITISKPGFVIVTTNTQLPIVKCPQGGVALRCRLGPAGTTRSFQVEARTEPSDSSDPNYHKWIRA